MIRKTALASTLLGLLACSPIDVEEYADDSKEAKAIEYIQKIIDGDFVEISNVIEPSLKPELTDDVLQQMRDRLGTEEPKERNLIGYNEHTHNQEPTRYNLTYQYGYENRWILLNVAFRTLTNGKDEIVGLNVYSPMDRPLQEVHRFTLEGKGVIHYLFLTVCILTPLFILFTIVAVIRTKFKKRKWLWFIFVLVGIVQFSLNWTTGQFDFKLLNFQIFGAGALTAGLYAPWILSFSLPIGALLFWIRRKKLKLIEIQPDASDDADKPRI